MASIDRESDLDGMVDFCPFEGTVNELTRYGNKLMYEGKVALARACFAKSMRRYLRPMWRPNAQAPPLPNFREEELLPNASKLDAKEFNSARNVGRLIHEGNVIAYGLDMTEVEAQRKREYLEKQGFVFHNKKKFMW